MFYEEVGVTHHGEDEIPWVPWEIAEGVFLKVMKIDPIHGLMLIMLKAPGGIGLGRHRHTGFVQLYTVQGAWKYNEHKWIARKGGVVYETANSVHSFVTLPGEDTIVFVVLNGTLEFLDENDKVLWTETWRTAIERQRAWCAANGLRVPDVTSFAET